MAEKEVTFKVPGATEGARSGSRIRWDQGETKVLDTREIEHVNSANYETRPLRPKESGDDPEEVPATSAARDLAEEEGLDLSSLDGSGVDGKVLKGDVQDALDG